MTQQIQRDVFGVSDALFAYLTQKCADCTLRFKASSSLDKDDYQEITPRVFLYTFDDDTTEIPSPCVLIQPTLINQQSIHYVLYISVAHPAIQECEIVDEVPAGSRHYQYRDGSEFTSDGVRRELYRACLMLENFIFFQMMQWRGDGKLIQNLVANPPSPFMENFPACECTVEFDFTYETRTSTYAGTRLQELL